MKNWNQPVVWMLSFAFAMFGGLGQTPLGSDLPANKILKPAPNWSKRLPILTPREGTGPQCYPGASGCQSQ